MSTSTIAPIFLGATGDVCWSCQENGKPLFSLPCHPDCNMLDLVCRDCLIKFWAINFYDVVKCPKCDRPSGCGFEPIPPTQELTLDRHFYEIENIESIRSQWDILNGTLAFTGCEAVFFLKHAFEQFADQVLDRRVLGDDMDIFDESGKYTNNMIFTGICKALTEPCQKGRKAITQPLQLEEDLQQTATTLVAQYAMKYFSFRMEAVEGLDISNVSACEHAIMEYRETKVIFQNWVAIIGKTVELLTWRNLQRIKAKDMTVEQQLADVKQQLTDLQQTLRPTVYCR